MFAGKESFSVYRKCCLFQPLSFTHKSAKTHQTAATHTLMCAPQLLATEEQQSYITLPPLIFQGFLKNKCVFKCRAPACRRAAICEFGNGNRCSQGRPEQRRSVSSEVLIGLSQDGAEQRRS